MIHGTCVFSMADLDDLSGYLYGLIKLKGIEYKCEIKEDNSVYDENDKTYYIKRKCEDGSVVDETVKHNKVYDLQHSNKKLW